MVKLFCAHHVDGHLQAAVKIPTAVFDQEQAGPQSKSVSIIEETVHCDGQNLNQNSLFLHLIT
jgi:hypothetical protein